MVLLITSHQHKLHKKCHIKPKNNNVVLHLNEINKNICYIKTIILCCSKIDLNHYF